MLETFHKYPSINFCQPFPNPPAFPQVKLSSGLDQIPCILSDFAFIFC